MTPESLGIEPPPPLCAHDDPSWCDEECTRKRAVYEQWLHGEWTDVDDIIRAQPWRTRVIIRWYGFLLWLRSF